MIEVTYLAHNGYFVKKKKYSFLVQVRFGSELQAVSLVLHLVELYMVEVNF